MTPEQKCKCRQIYSYYGRDSQLRQLAEECAELIQAVTKLSRAYERGDDVDCFKAEVSLREEVADVTIMLSQLREGCMLFENKTGMSALISRKLDRQLERIRKEMEER